MKKTTQRFSVALTDYGWALDTDEERIGLFLSQRQAVSSARAHMRSRKAQGLASQLVVTGADVDGERKVVLPFARFR